MSTDLENKAAWKECFSVKGVRLPTGYYLGVSAATGDLSDNHDILSIRFYELDMPGDVSLVKYIFYKYQSNFNLLLVAPKVSQRNEITCLINHVL